MLHYHIHWTGKDTLDWESFNSRAAAEASAKNLVRIGETYTIEERDESCPRCRAAFKSITSYEPKKTRLGTGSDADQKQESGEKKATA
jgi:hypothetical protein